MIRPGTSVVMVAASLAACQLAEQPFKANWQFCLTEKQDAASARSWLAAVASNEEMELWDRSETAQQELDSLLPDDSPLRDSFPVFFTGAKNEDLSVTISNLGLGTDQLLVTASSFSREKLESRSRGITRDLGLKWNLHVLPEHDGALPLECENQ